MSTACHILFLCTPFTVFSPLLPFTILNFFHNPYPSFFFSQSFSLYFLSLPFQILISFSQSFLFIFFTTISLLLSSQFFSSSFTFTITSLLIYIFFPFYFLSQSFSRINNFIIIYSFIFSHNPFHQLPFIIIFL